MQQMQHYGQALTQAPSNLNDEVEKELAKHYLHEAGFRKMHAAITGGGSETDLGPSEFQQKQAQQTAVLEQQATTVGAQQAAQAQSQQTSVNAPPAPTGPQGVSTPYAAQKAPGALSVSGNEPSGQPPATPPPAPGPSEGEEEQS
jgi:hypothetical protein